MKNPWIPRLSRGTTARVGKKFFILIFFIIFSMSSCVNYAGIHAHSIPYSPEDLTTEYIYPLPKPSSTLPAPNWWSQFHETQLDQLINVALCESPNLQIAQSRVEEAKHMAEAAGASLWPAANFYSMIRRERFSEFGVVGPPFNGTTQNIGFLGLNFTYELDFWGKNRENLAAKISTERAQEAELAESRLILSTSIASTYFNLQYHLSALDIAQQIYQQRQALLKITQARISHHIESDIPLNVAKSDAEAAEFLVAQSKEAVMVNRHQLAILIGKNPLTTKIEIPTFQYDERHYALPPAIPANLLAQRPDIQAARFRAESAAHTVKSQTAKFFPNINLEALTGLLSIVGLEHLFNSESSEFGGQGALSLPIFDAGLLRANLKTDYAEYDEAIESYNQTIIAALGDVADQLSHLNSIKLQQQAESNIVNLTKHNYKLSTLRYNHGIIDYSQVLGDQGTLLNQQFSQLQLENQRIQFTIAMIKALGGNYCQG